MRLWCWMLRHAARQKITTSRKERRSVDVSRSPPDSYLSCDVQEAHEGRLHVAEYQAANCKPSAVQHHRLCLAV